MKIFLIYFAAVSLLTAVVTVYDKLSAKAGNWRIPEKTLLTLAVIGGAAAEWAVMLAIRHKTKHKKFMVGLPVILSIQVLAVAAWLLLF